MPRRAFLVRAGIACLIVLAVCLPWAGVEYVLWSEDYPDRATFEWLELTRATERIVLVHMGTPSLRLVKPTPKQLMALEGVYQTPPSDIEPQGDVWAYNAAGVAFRPDTLCTAYVYFTPNGRVCNIAFAFYESDVHGPKDFADIQANPNRQTPPREGQADGTR